MAGYTAAFHATTATDYNDAYIWYETQQEGLGEKFLAAVRGKLNKILDNPEIFGVKLRPGYHEALVDGFPYSIVYRINKKQKIVFINSIHHQRKHPRKKYRK